MLRGNEHYGSTDQIIEQPFRGEEILIIFLFCLNLYVLENRNHTFCTNISCAQSVKNDIGSQLVSLEMLLL
jgi:hypothetical protein